MIGAIIGDIIGSPYERWNHKGTDFALFSSRSRFTDDTVLTVAVADALLHGKAYAQTFVDYVFAYPDAGYGGTLLTQALTGKLRPYNSWGNGSAMRVCPVGWPKPNAAPRSPITTPKAHQRGPSHRLGGLPGAARGNQSVHQGPNRQAVRLRPVPAA
jgi:ADP-ribosylglycohydrolase